MTDTSSIDQLVLGIDVGGTYTDFTAYDETADTLYEHKTRSTPANPSDAVLTGIDELAERFNIGREELLDRTRLIVHGTTIATNAVLTGEGATTGLLTTEGFRDILEIRRGIRSRENLYNNKYEPPEPLVPRHRRVGVTERVDADGDVVTPLDIDSLETAAEDLGDVDTVAICFMHSYANGDHETEAANHLEETFDDAFLTVSSDVLPEAGHYSRVSTTAMNAYVGPVVDRYLNALEDRLESNGFEGSLQIMQSNGGIAPPASVAKRPATTVLSGPAGAPVGANQFAEDLGFDRAVVADMGGTSFDVSLVSEGSVNVTTDGEINRQPVSLPMCDVNTIGAGGGSIAWVDDGGLLRIGPDSAGADPGPACYGRGGEQPTCTDADLLLGYLNPEKFVDGTFDVEAAEVAVKSVADELDYDLHEAASGIFDIINLSMARAIEDITLSAGYDPREFPLAIGGGAGPIHAAGIAHELDIETIIIPQISPVLAAFGMLTADLRHDYVRGFHERWTDIDPATIRETIYEMVGEGREALDDEGVARKHQRMQPAIDLRYRGQHHELTIDVPMDEIERGDLGQVPQRFDAKHESLYGYAMEGEPLEILSLRVTAEGIRQGVLDDETVTGDVTRTGTRTIRDPVSKESVEATIHEGAAMNPNESIPGPAVIESPSTAIVVPSTFTCESDQRGSFILNARGGSNE